MNGIFTENKLTFENFPKNQLNDATEEKSKKININTATIEELDQLPGIGKVTAEKIINNRPYLAIEELLTKKIVKKSVYEKIIDMITTD